MRTICPGEGCREHHKKQKCRCGNGSVAAAFIWADTEKALKSRAFGQNEKVGNFYQNYLPFVANNPNFDTNAPPYRFRGCIAVLGGAFWLKGGANFVRGCIYEN